MKVDNPGPKYFKGDN